MDRIRIFIISVALLSFSVIAQAQATRTWVSGVGDDVNPCSRTAPCKTFAGAISKTAAGGEISVLDPGGFGAVTITKSITIDGTGQVGSVLNTVTNGVIINFVANNASNPPDTTGHVVLRNLTFQGVQSGNTAIQIGPNAIADVQIEHCNIVGWGSGVLVNVGSGNTRVSVKDTTITNSKASPGYGVYSNPSGTATVGLTLDGCNIHGMQFSAVALESATNAIIANSLITNNRASGLYVRRTSCTADVYHSSISNNNAGIVIGDAGGGAIRLYGSQVSQNTFNGILITAGTVGTAGNNTIQGNGGPSATNLILNTQ
jgi:hypothetical protein